MSNEGGPWGHEPTKPDPPRSRGRFGLWLVLAVGLIGLVIALIRAFPEALQDGRDWANLGYAVALALVVSAGLARARRGMLRQYLRYAAIWTAILAVLMLAVAFRDELTSVPQRLRMAFLPGDPVATGDRELVIPQNEEGAFLLVAKVNGQRIRFIVDTGATDTVLSPADAQRLGVDVEALRYTDAAETANGVGYSAAWVADTLEVGPIRLDKFRMSVNQAPMSASLLGMSFLRRMESFEHRDRKLILRWRDP